MIVLDTHALVWWINGDGPLSRSAKSTIDKELAAEDGAIMISSICAWEITMLVNADRLTLTMAVDDWLETVSEIEGYTSYRSGTKWLSNRQDSRGSFTRIRQTG